MNSRQRPAVDATIAPKGGTSRDGQPMSHNRAPSADLSPWIARLYATVVEIPSDHQIRCGLFNDTAVLRAQLAGSWSGTTRDGPHESGRTALLFGPQAHRMPVNVLGSFISVGMSLRPGACHALWKLKMADFVDRLVPAEQIVRSWAGLADRLDPAADPEDWLTAFENLMRAEIDRVRGAQPDPVTARFEAASFINPNISIAEFAEECGVERRRLERIILRDFGLSPKQVLRRARALDMASDLRGVADREESNEIALRYYDQSHLIHDFSELFGMAPSQFVAKPQPLLTLTLESRQARRLEAINRLAPGEARPWQ